MPFPLKLNASPDLIVNIHLHEFFLGDRQRQCWTYLTTGLAAYGQKEMSLSLLLEDDDSESEFPRTPIKIFQLLENHARGGKIVEVADATKLGKTGLFGFTALYYLPAIQYEGLPDCDNHLALMLVHQAEYEFAKRYGFTRLLSRIGKFCSSFPYPSWNTRRRPSLFKPGHREESVLNEIELHVLKAAHAELLDGVALLRLQTTDGQRLVQYLQQLVSQNKTFALQTTLSLAANACLSWEPGQTNPGAYTSPDEVTRIGAAFIMFEMAEATSGRLMEDGFLISLTDHSINRIISDCESTSDSGILESPGIRLHLQWHKQDDGYVQPVVAYEHRAGWTDLKHTSNEPPADKITLKSITDISANASEKVNREHLAKYVDEIQAFLLSSMREEAEELTLTIRVKIQNNTATYDISADIELDPEFTTYMATGLSRLNPCRASLAVTFDFVFCINS